MNPKALHSLADFIERRQDIDFYYPDVRHCVLGFATRQLGLDAPDARYIGPGEKITKVNHHLGITNGQATAMFAEPQTADGRLLMHSEVSRDNAITMLRRAAETGSIFFNEPTKGDREMGNSCGCPFCRQRRRPGLRTINEVQQDQEMVRMLRSAPSPVFIEWEAEPSAEVKEPETA